MTDLRINLNRVVFDKQFVGGKYIFVRIPN